MSEGRDRTAALKERVARHFSPPEWFTTFEFPLWDSVPVEGARDRQLDALAISRVASRSNELVGIEVKTDRADWLRELSDPLKAEGWTRLVDRFCVVASKGVVKVGEVPQGWGFLEESGSGLKRLLPGIVITRWKENGGGVDPVPRSLWVRVLRRTLERDGIGPLIAAAHEQGRKEAVAASTEDAKRELQYALQDLDAVKRRVAEFEKKSGVKIDDWAAGRIGEAVKVVLVTRDLVRTTGYSFKNIRDGVEELGDALRATGWVDDDGEGPVKEKPAP
jgi:hypothetical protein